MINLNDRVKVEFPKNLKKLDFEKIFISEGNLNWLICN